MPPERCSSLSINNMAGAGASSASAFPAAASLPPRCRGRSFDTSFARRLSDALAQCRKIEAVSATTVLGAAHHGIEVRRAVGIAGNELGVEDHAFERQGRDGRGNQPETACEIAPVLAVDGHRVVGEVELRPEAVMLYFVQHSGPSGGDLAGSGRREP